MKETETLYNIPLHKLTQLVSNSGIYIMRVPGGWIYSWATGNEDEVGIFVPYNTEFLEEEEVNYYIKLAKKLLLFLYRKLL